MLVVGFAAMRLREPLLFKLRCLHDELITQGEFDEFLRTTTVRLRSLLHQCFGVSAFHSAIITCAAEILNLHSAMRREADATGQPLEQVEFRCVLEESHRIAQEFGAFPEYILNVLSDILAQYTDLDRPPATDEYRGLDVQVVIPEGLDRGW